jgi:hypothetical protein
MKTGINHFLALLLLAVFLNSCDLLPQNSSTPTASAPIQEATPGPGAKDTRLSGSVDANALLPTQTAQLGAYILEIYGPAEAQAPYLVFKKGDKPIKEMEVGVNDQLELVNAEEDGRAQPLCQLTDGKDPNVVVMHYLAGGNNQCHIFSLGETVRQIATIKSCGTSLIFEKMKNSDMLEIVTEDLYRDFGIEAIAPQVMLKWSHGKFVLDTAEMKKRRLNANSGGLLHTTISDKFKNISPDAGETITQAPPDLADQIIGMYYCGEGRKAKTYFDKCWPQRAGGKKAYWSFLISEMKKSPYWPEIKALNRGS